MRRGLVSTIVGIVVVVAFSSVSRAALDLTTQLPTVVAQFVAVNYDAGSHVFTATGYTDETDMANGDVYNTYVDNFSLTASINNDGSIDTGGSFSLDVYGDDVGNGSSALLFHSTDLSQFDYMAEDKFEFVFSRPGSGAGDLASPGSDIGVILDGRQITSFSTPSFTASFSNDGQGNSYTFPVVVPEPATGMLAAVGLGLLLRRRRTA